MGSNARHSSYFRLAQKEGMEDPKRMLHMQGR